MASLLDRLKGPETGPELNPEVPDHVPEEWAPELAQDPAPGKAKPVRAKLRTSATSGNVTPALRKRISAEIEAYIELVAMPVILRDETCGAVLHEQAQPIADALTAILARYPDLAHKFLATGVLGDWIKLAVVVKPVIEVGWRHHVAKQPEQGEQGDLDVDAFPAYRPGQ